MGLPLEDVLVPLTISELKTHGLIIGATGSGKTTLIHHLMAQDILKGHSFAVLDMRGDLVNAAIELCSDHVEPGEVALFDLREKHRPLGFNPLAGAGEPYFRALGVLDVVATESESFGVQLAETLRMAVMLLAEVRAPLTDLERVFYNSVLRGELVAQCRNEPVVSFWTRYSALSPDRQQALAMPVLNKVSLLFATDSLRRMLGNPTPCDLGAHLNRRGSVTLVSLAVDELHAAGRMVGSMLLATICREIFSRVEIPEPRRNPVRLYVDEFEHFGTKEFETILAEGRRFGLSLVLAHQTLAQLAPKVRSMILNNVGVKVVFRSGREDGSTLSKDLTGDPKAINVSLLEVGEAVLARRGEAPFVVEINAPLFDSVGVRSASARRFLAQIAERVPAWSPPAPPTPPTPKADTMTPRETASTGRRSLEDWL